MEPILTPPAFSSQNVSPVNAQENAAMTMPNQIKWFEIFMYVSIGLSFLTSFSMLGLPRSSGLIGSGVDLINFSYAIVKIVLVFLTVRKRMNWARITLTALIVIDIVNSLAGLAFSSLYINFMYIIPLMLLNVIQVIGLFLVYSSVSNQWFSQSIPTRAGLPAISRLWLKGIPTINIVFMVVSVALVFVLDLIIMISSPELAPFWIGMLIVFLVFLVFFYLENFVFKKRYSQSSSNLDTPIVVLIVIRNIVFVLNFIPYIQIAGAVIAIFGIIPCVIIYSILLSKRGKASK